jgi:peptide/nickel transport system substrate-binding protein
VEYRVISDPGAQEVAFKNGEINLFRATDVDTLNSYKDDKNYKVYSMPEGRINYLTLNGQNPTTKDIKAREAIIKALNIPEIVKGAYDSDEIATPATGIYHDQDIYYNKDIKNYQQDLETAKKLIDETGLKNKMLKIVYNNARAGIKESDIMVNKQLAEVGIKSELVAMDPAGFGKALFFEPNWDIAFNGYASNGNERYTFWLTPGNPMSGNSSLTPEIGELWTKADTETDKAKRQENYDKVLTKIKDQYTMVPVSTTKSVMITNVDNDVDLTKFLTRYFVKIY